MLILVIGAAASGKSEYAENLAMKLGQNKKKLYIATMEPFGEEAKYRIQRHHKLREEKGFDTHEKYRDFGEVEVEGYHTILLECVSTLLANELFGMQSSIGSYYDSIFKGIKVLEQNSQHLIIVTNKVFSDGVEYSEETQAYIRAFGKVNQGLAKKADVVIEVACGIPIIHKGKEYLHE